jgi:hypothetical protein
LEFFTAVTIRFDDQWPSLREVDGLSDTAFRLHVSAFFWCKINRTDGLITREDLGLVCARVRAPERFAAECVRRGAWHDARQECGSEFCLGYADADGWITHDYLKDNPSRAELEAEEAGKSRGGKRGNHRRWHEDRGLTQEGCEFCFPQDGKPAYPQDKKPAPRETIPKRAETPSHNRSHMRSVSESHATPSDRSDQDHLSGVNQVSHPADRYADTREEHPVLVASVAETAAEKAGRLVSDGEALRAIAEIRKRAAIARKAIHDPLKYIPAAVANEPDIFLLILGEPPELGEILAAPAPPGPDRHQYDHDPATGVCTCGWPRSYAARHGEARSA